jgi:capsular exopolysaccharide synthesis family protein
MENQNISDDLRHYMSLILQWGWLLVLVTVLTGGAAYVVSMRMLPVYSASTTLLINEAPATRFTDYNSVLTSERLAKTYAEMLTKQPVLQGVIDSLGLDMDATELRKVVDVQFIRDTQLIVVRVEDTHPLRAANIANAIAVQFAEENQAMQASRYAASKESLSKQLSEMDQQISRASVALQSLSDTSADTDMKSEYDRLTAELSQYRQTYAYLLQSFEQVRLAEAQSTSTVVQVEAATMPQVPIRPRPLMNTILFGMIGLLLAMGVVYLIETLDDTVRSPDEAARQLGLPLLGMVARHEVQQGKPVTAAAPRSPVAEAFRSLRTNLQFATVDKPLRTLLVTSPSPSDGKSTVAANLAVVMAQSGRKVAVIDADLRRPRMHRLFGMHNRLGLSGLFFQPEVMINGALQKTSIENLFALTTGDLPPNPAELLGSEKMGEIMRLLEEEVNMVILDTPPVMAVTDAAVLAPRVDGVLLVVKPGTTKLAAARQAVDQLRRVNANLLGIVLNEVDLSRRKYYYHYYKGYYYHYAYNEYYGESGSRRSARRGRSAENMPKEEGTPTSV